MVCRETCSSARLGHHLDVELSKVVRLTPSRLLQTWYNPSVDYHGDTRLSFEDHVNAYQGRTLKWDIDRLFTFEGLLQSQELDTVFDVPIMKIPPDSHEPINIGFAHGLAWRNTTRPNGCMSPSNCIPQFPSGVVNIKDGRPDQVPVFRPIHYGLQYACQPISHLAMRGDRESYSLRRHHCHDRRCRHAVHIRLICLQS